MAGLFTTYVYDAFLLTHTNGKAGTQVFLIVWNPGRQEVKDSAVSMRTRLVLCLVVNPCWGVSCKRHYCLLPFTVWDYWQPKLHHVSECKIICLLEAYNFVWNPANRIFTPRQLPAVNRWVELQIYSIADLHAIPVPQVILWRINFIFVFNFTQFILSLT